MEVPTRTARLDERHRHLSADRVDEGLGFGAFPFDDEVAALNDFGEEIDVHSGGTGVVSGPELDAFLLRELPDQHTAARDGVVRRLCDQRPGVKRPALVPRVRRAGLVVEVAGLALAAVSYTHLTLPTKA